MCDLSHVDHDLWLGWWTQTDMCSSQLQCHCCVGGRPGTPSACLFPRLCMLCSLYNKWICSITLFLVVLAADTAASHPWLSEGPAGETPLRNTRFHLIDKLYDKAYYPKNSDTSLIHSIITTNVFSFILFLFLKKIIWSCCLQKWLKKWMTVIFLVLTQYLFDFVKL